MAALAGAVLEPVTTVTVGVAIITLVFLYTTGFRVAYLLAGYRAVQTRRPAPAGAADDLPRYTVFVPVYREANVVPALAASLGRLEYPRDLLEVLFLVEHDDEETRRACEASLRPGWQVITVPPGEPRTKPRALNVGLAHATGELLTIYDAEDRPEPDQLLKAARAFAAAPYSLAALQARLDFYNAHQNLLTKWFTCEYTAHFGLYLEGIGRLRHPMPLGGTSTHFRTWAIRQVGGWDAWNVTEDCELGMRLACAGFVSGTLDSVTWEEAVPSLRSWVRQRSRWVKGFAQTGLALLRAPLGTARSMGWRRFLGSLASVAGVPVTLVAQIVFWTALWLYVGLRTGGADVEPIERLFPEPFLTLGLVSLFIGNFVVLLAFVSAVYERRRYELVPHAIAIPLYWTLHSIGAWKGVTQLLKRPHFWEKTTHGLAAEPAPRGRPGLDAAAYAASGNGAGPEPEAGTLAPAFADGRDGEPARAGERRHGAATTGGSAGTR